MIPALTPLGTPPLAALPAGLDQSTADPFVALLARVRSAQELIFLLVARPFDPARPAILAGPPSPLATLPLAGGPDHAYTGTETVVYASDKGYRTRPGDALPNQAFPPRLQTPLTRQAAIPVGDGKATQSFGAIVALNDAAQGGPGALDSWLDYAWDGRDIDVRGGIADLDFVEFGLVFKGTAQGLEWDEGRISIRLRDRREAFTGDVPVERYAGTGGAEGGADLAGTVKPVCLGAVLNVSPVLVDATRLIYQIGRDLRAVGAVRDRGVALAAAGDVPDIFATTVAGGSYKTSLAAGLVRLGATPAGTVTADAIGPAAAGDTTGSIVRYVATTLLGAAALSENDLELGSFADLDALQPGPVGRYLDQPIAGEALVDELMAGIGGWWSFDRDGRMVVGRLDRPGDAAGDIEARDIQSIARSPVPAPVWRHRVDHQRSWTVQGDDDLAGAVDAAERELWGRQYRSASAQDSVTRGSHRLARDRVVVSLFADSADAAAEADRLQALHGRPRDRYRVTLRRSLLRYALGETRTLTYARFGLDQGRAFRVVGLVEDIARDRVELELWG